MATSSVLAQVLAAVQAGVPQDSLASKLGIDPGLAALAVEHWVRLGVVTDPASLRLGCATCPPPAARSATCKGCPFG